MSPFITMPPVARRESPTLCSKGKETQAKPTSNTTTASLMGVSIDHSFIFVLYFCVAPARSLSSFGYHQGGLKTKHRQEGDQQPNTEAPHQFGASQDAPALGRFSVGELYRRLRPSRPRRRQVWLSPVSFVGSQVPMAYPLRQETGIVTGRVEQVRTVALQASPSPYPYYPPTWRERSTDKHPRSTYFALHPQP